MRAYYPFGEKLKPSKQMVLEQENMFKQYDYYGIPYGIIDANSEEKMTQKEIDREKAKLFIASKEPIPQELVSKLLRYKAEDNNKKSSKRK